MFGRNLRVAHVRVQNVSGTGIRLDPPDYTNIHEPQLVWVNSVFNSHASNCGTGFYTGSSDSWYWGNQFVDNDNNISELRGDVKWFGNKFTGGSVGLKSVFANLRNTQADLTVDQIFGNRFELSAVGLMVTNGNARDGFGVEIIPELDATINGNVFADNETAISFENYIGVTVTGNRLVTSSPGAVGIRFKGVSTGLLKNLDFRGPFQSELLDLPKGVFVAPVP
jgi:hypothetical protein